MLVLKREVEGQLKDQILKINVITVTELVIGQLSAECNIDKPLELKKEEIEEAKTREIVGKGLQ